MSKILIIEDEEAIADLEKDYLELSGFTVEIEERGDTGLTRALAEDFDLIILDLGLPDKDGMTLLSYVRKDSLTPIIVLSARSDERDKVKALDKGANDYITKPFGSAELLARIRAMTREQTVQATSRLQVGNITLDRATFELSSPTGRLRLANKEFQMLELLMCNPRNLISTERFLEKIWGYDNEAEINVVWVHISNLRKKLRSIGSHVTIRASRGLGYLLEVEV